MIRLSRWRIISILIISVLGVLFTLPNFLTPSSRKALPSFLQDKKLRLGLDLQGGSYMLLEVDTQSALNERLESLVDVSRDVLRKNKIPVQRSFVNKKANDHVVVVELRNENELEQSIALLKENLPESLIFRSAEKIHIRLGELEAQQLRKSVMEKSITIIERRVDQMGTTEPEIQPMDNDRIAIQLPGVDDPERVKKLINKTAKLTFHMVKKAHAGGEDDSMYKASYGHMIVPSMETEEIDGKQVTREYYEVSKRALLTGDSLVGASSGFDQERNDPIVNFSFDTAGARKFAQITEDNVGKMFAMVLDNKVISAPRINGKIPFGSGQIFGSFTMRTAEDLAILMRAGALPASLTVLEEKTVGPSLGSDSIAAGQKATIFSILLVGIFMVVVYNLFGLFANVALTMNLVLLVAGLSLIEATLTLPGIAGIALTIGMAVDANVLIFERIREELNNGRSPVAAVDHGFNRAFATIVDSNLTTVIGAVLLFWFGTGVIRGFAVTLCLGIGISMFTAISLTRVIIIWWINSRRPKKTLPV